MGLRSLIEFNHDNTHQIERDPVGFATALASYIRGGSKRDIDALFSQYDARAIALRHSSDNYYIGRDEIGFPARLPWDDFEKERADALVKASELTQGQRRTRSQLEAMVVELVQIIARQQEVLDQ